MNSNKTVLVLPVNAVGHIHATVSIADRLKKDHGCRTVFLTIGPTIDVIKDHGHELIEMEEFDVYEEQVGNEKKAFPGYKKWPRIIARGEQAYSSDKLKSFLGIMDQVGEWVIKELVDNDVAVEREIEKIQPDLIVLDYIAAPLCIVKHQHTRPWVQVRSPNPLGMLVSARADGIKPPCFLGVKLYTKEERQRMAREEPERWAALLKFWKEKNDLVESVYKDKLMEIEKYYKANGIVMDSVQSCSPHLNIYYFPEAMDYDRDDDLMVYPPRWVRCESMVRQPVGQKDSQEIQFWSKKLGEAMRDKKEMVYFSLGSIASGRENLMQKYIDYLKDDHERLYVISKGVNGDKFELNSSNMIGANYLPQTFFLERAKLAIIHGGNNGITESMYYGVPMIVLPMFGDQMDNAQRVEDVGLGCQLSLYHCSRRELRDAIERLTGNSELASKMRSIGEKMRSNDDLDRLSLLLKTLMDNKCLDEELIQKYQT